MTGKSILGVWRLNDEEIAAKAVAFVIGSARKGVHAHCTEIACLLQRIKVLEIANAQLRQDMSKPQKEKQEAKFGRKKKSRKLVAAAVVQQFEAEITVTETVTGKVDVGVSCSVPTETEIQLRKTVQQCEARIKTLEEILTKNNIETRLTVLEYRGDVTETREERLERLRVYAPFPLTGCICKNCQTENEAGAHQFVLLSRGCPLLNLGDKVLTRSGKRGSVRYVGHMDSSDELTVVYAGIELELPERKTSGVVDGTFYFECAEGFGYFVPLHRIECVVRRAALSDQL